MDFKTILDYVRMYWQPFVGLVLFVFYLVSEWRANKLSRIVDLVVLWLKDYAGEEMGDITRVEVNAAAKTFYDNYISGSPLAYLVSLPTLQEAAWDGLCKLRDSYITSYFTAYGGYDKLDPRDHKLTKPMPK